MNKMLLVVMGFVGGSILVFGLEGGNYLKGRLSACNKFVSGMNRSMPVTLVCTVEKGEVLLTIKEVPGVRYSLDGTRL